MKKIKLSKIKKNYKLQEKLINKFKIATDSETLDKMCEGMSICRYGDGELGLIFGQGIGFQPYNKVLVQRLREILIDKNCPSNMMVAIPKVFRRDFSNYVKKSYDFWDKYYRKNVVKISKLIDKEKKYYSSQVTRFYIDAEDKKICDEYITKFKKIWDGKDVLIVEGVKSRMGVGNDLFKKANTIKRILCPAENAFEKYDEILKSCLECSKEYVILIALGPTATVLAYDLNAHGYQALDIGHIDIEYEWYLQKAKWKIKIENKYVNEAGGFSGQEEINDTSYQNSIIKIIN